MHAQNHLSFSSVQATAPLNMPEEKKGADGEEKSSDAEWLAPHLKLAKGSIPPFVLVAGDPARIASLAALCDTAEEVTHPPQ